MTAVRPVNFPQNEPLITPELVEVRWRQRRILAALPDQIVSRGASRGLVDETKLGTRPERARTECGLRLIVPQLMDEHDLTPMIDDLERSAVARNTFLFLNENHAVDFPLTPDGHALERFLRDTQSGMKERVPLKDNGPFLDALALVLIWADAVSDDLYLDPRLLKHGK